MNKFTAWGVLIFIGLAITGGAVYFQQKTTDSFLASPILESSQTKNPNPTTKPVANPQNSKIAGNETIVTKVIDGDTAIVSGGDHVRLLGIDSDEKGYPCYEEAKNRLEELVLSKPVRLEADASDKDQYGRLLRYIFFNGQNINKQLVSEGLAIARFYPENQKYKDEITAAETAAIKNKTGCKWGGKSQTAVPVVAPAAVNLKWEKLTGDKIVDVCETKNYLNQEVIAQGTVADAYISETQTLFLNFGKKYPDSCFAAVVFKSNLNKFPANPEILYTGKTIRVKGKIQEYLGKPEIILNDINQIEVGN